MVFISTFKQLSRFAVDLSRDILSTGCATVNFATGTSAGTGNCPHNGDTIDASMTTGHPGDRLDKGYQEMQTIKHETTFRKSKSIFCRRHLSVGPKIEAEDSDAPNDLLVWTRVFDPVFVPSGDIENTRGVDGNVDFLLRSLNGPFGIWRAEMPHQSLLDVTDPHTDHFAGDFFPYYMLLQQDHLRYYLVPSGAKQSASVEQTQILVTRTPQPTLRPYNPMRPSGPWCVRWNQRKGAFVHFVKRSVSTNNNLSEPSVRFLLDESILGTTYEQREQFSRETFVSFSECQTRERRTFGLVDNHVTTGPLRVILASGCYRWPGGIVLRLNGAFRPDRTISRYHALHARVSREVLVQNGDNYGTVLELLDEHCTQRVHAFFKVIRLATYSQVETLSQDHPDVVSNVRAFFLKLSSGIEQLRNLHALKRALQPFVLFLASNCLDVDLMVDDWTSTYAEGELHNFEVLYRFVLGLLPDRRTHQVFRDCIGSRIAMAIDSK